MLRYGCSQYRDILTILRHHRRAVGTCEELRTRDAGADSDDYTPAPADEGHDLRVEATYLDGSGSGPDADLFTIDGATGQIRVGSGTVLDYETPPRSYSVTVAAADPSGARDDIAVTVA